MESSGINVLDRDAGVILNIIDIALRIHYLGCLKHNKTNHVIVIKTEGNMSCH